MKNKLVWRLGKLPSVEELRELVKDKIITQEEAREVLFNFETDEERDSKSLKEEIKFLRETIEKLANNQTTRIVEVVKETWKPYYTQPWFQPYQVWCSAGTNANYVSNGITTAGYVNTLGTLTSSAPGQSAFTEINTF